MAAQSGKKQRPQAWEVFLPKTTDQKNDSFPRASLCLVLKGDIEARVAHARMLSDVGC